GSRIADGEVGQDLAIERDVRLVQRRHEARVRDAQVARRRIDAHDPEATEVRLPLAPVKERVAPLAVDGLYCGLPELGAAAPESLGVLADPVPAMTGLGTTLGARHVMLSFNPCSCSCVREHGLDLMLLRLADISAPAQLALHRRRLV